MNSYELVFSDGTSIDFKAANLRGATRKAIELKADYIGKAWIYEGYTCRKSI